ncbi:g530 [Coccomyxa elongata]
MGIILATLIQKERARLAAEVEAKLDRERTEMRAEMEATLERERAQMRAEMEATLERERAQMRAEMEAALERERAQMRAEMEATLKRERAQMRAEMEATLKRERAQMRAEIERISINAQGMVQRVLEEKQRIEAELVDVKLAVQTIANRLGITDTATREEYQAAMVRAGLTEDRAIPADIPEAEQLALRTLLRTFRYR